MTTQQKKYKSQFTITLNKGPNHFSDKLHYEASKFPAGEIHVKIREDFKHSREHYESILIHGDIRSSDNIMELLTLKDALDRHLKWMDSTVGEINLEIGYVPYGRQDRVANVGESLSISVFARLLNSANFDKVFVTDPHSDVSTSLIDNCIVRDQSNFARKVILSICDPKATNNDNVECMIVIPDVGSYKKLEPFARSVLSPSVQFYKTRNTETGEITGTKSDNLNNVTNVRNFFIIDDICDGGRTFIEIAKVIREQYKGDDYKIHLIVSHGIFSKGKEVFDGLIDSVHAIYDWSV